MRSCSGPHRTDRREFVTAGLSLGSGALLSAAGLESPGSFSPDSRVVIARDGKLRSSADKIDEKRLITLLDRSIQSFYDRDDPLEGWRMVARPGQVVGLKVNCLAGRGLSTSTKLVEAVSERLQEAGIRSSSIVIWDRMNRDLERGGFKIKDSGAGPLCYGNDRLGFGQELLTYNAVGSLVCKTLTDICDVVVNLPVLKDHGITGMTMAMKNLFGAIHNPNKYHLSVGDPYVADVYRLPPIRNKVRLTISDAITAQYEGGPSYMPQWTWPFNGLIVGTDPVALDYVGWRILEGQRAAEGILTLKLAGREPSYIRTAADPDHRLGTDDPARIEILEV